MNRKLLYLLISLACSKCSAFLSLVRPNSLRQDELKRGFIEAAANGYTDELTEFLKKGADVNVRIKDNVTALHIAAQRGHDDCVKALIKAKADVNARDSQGDTALHCAAKQGHSNCVKMLIEAKSDVNIQGYYDRTPLQHAASLGDLSSLFSLINARADLTVRDREGRTILYEAAKNDRVTCVNVLVTYSYLLVPPAREISHSRKRVRAVLLSFLRLRKQHPQLDNLKSESLQFEILSRNKLLQEDLVFIFLDELKKGKVIKGVLLIRSKEAVIRYLLKKVNEDFSELKRTEQLGAALRELAQGTNLEDLVKEGLNQRIQELK